MASSRGSQDDGAQFSVRTSQGEEINFVAVDDPGLPARSSGFSRGSSQQTRDRSVSSPADHASARGSKAEGGGFFGGLFGRKDKDKDAGAASAQSFAGGTGGITPRGKAPGGLATRMLGGGGRPGDARNIRLVGAGSSEMRGWLHKQGAKVGTWSKRYFVLSGATLAYYADEKAAEEADEAKCRGVGYVVEAEHWPQGAVHRPAQVPESVFAAHGAAGFKVATDDQEMFVYAESEELAGKWVEWLVGAAALAAKAKEREAQARADAEAAEALPMPEQPELDRLLQEMLDAQGYKEEAKANILLLPDAHKWQLMKSYQQSLVKESGDIRAQPEHWINVLNIEPSAENLSELSVPRRQHIERARAVHACAHVRAPVQVHPLMRAWHVHGMYVHAQVLLRQQSVGWVCEFLELRGVEALCELLELLEKRTARSPARDAPIPAGIFRAQCTLEVAASCACCISVASRLHLGCISVASRLNLGGTSAASRRQAPSRRRATSSSWSACCAACARS